MLFFGKKTCREGHLMDPSWKICPVCLAPICGWLVIIKGKFKNKVYTFHEGKTKIGSGSDCEVRIMVKSISRLHAMIIGKEGHYTISDLNSAGGTFVNGTQVTSKEIIDGDLLQLGDIQFRFKCL